MSVSEVCTVQASQCPAGQAVGQFPNKDYGALIDPRVKGTQSNISADSTL